MSAFVEPPQPTEGATRPSRWALSNWPVGWKVFAIVVVPLLLVGVLGGLRVQSGWSSAGELRRAADRAAMVPAIEGYTAALEGALLANSAGGDAQAALNEFDTSKQKLRNQLAETDVAPDVRTGVTGLLDDGQALIDKVTANGIDLRGRITDYAPILLSAEDAINGSVRVDDERIRAEAQGLSRAVGARGQMAMEQLLVNLGGELPEPELRTSMITLAGTEPSTLSGMSQVLGVGSPEAQKLQQEMVRRMALMSDPAVNLVGNPDLSQSLQSTDDIANGVVDTATAAVTSAVDDQADAQRREAIRDSAIVGAAILVTLLIVLVVARSLVRPLRRLRDGALRVAHDDLAREIERVRAGGEPGPVTPLPVNTTEEVGQVAHAVDELHEQAVLLAGEQARLQLQIGDMFETLSRRSRSLVDQQLGIIDRLERDEEDPERLDSLFQLDHLAARMRRNGANLLVLAGSPVQREAAEPVPLATVVNAAASEVEDYARIVAEDLPEIEIVGAVAGDLVHLLAELLDNALRYSPPVSHVRVSATRTGNGGLVLEIEDEGLGMADGDLRVANTRLQSGGEVNPYTARHMGLFVVGKLAAQHGLAVRLRTTVAAQPGSGTTAGVFIPAESLLHGAGEPWATDDDVVDAEPHLAMAPPYAVDEEDHAEYAHHEDVPDRPEYEDAPAPERRNGHVEVPISLLPQRNPGASGIAGIPSPPIESPPAEAEDRWAEREWQHESWPVRAVPVDAPPAEPASRPAADPHPATGGSIFDSMLSEWLIDDPFTLAQSTDLDWQTVWDKGWSAAAAAEEAPVEERTSEGLPVRQPGARLIPGAAADDRPQGRNGGTHRGVDAPQPPDDSAADTGPIAIPRDPEAVRSSIGSHFGGVAAGRSRAREARPSDED